MLSSCTAISSFSLEFHVFFVSFRFFPLCILLILDYGEGIENNMGRVQGVGWP